MRRARACVAFFCLLGGCIDDASFQRVTFGVHVSGAPRDASTPLSVTTPLGWNVTFETASIGLGPIYFRNAPPPMGASIDSGRVTSEVLATFTVDALDPVGFDVLEGGIGTSERVGQAEVRFVEPSVGEVADASNGRGIAWVSGTATKGALSLRFAGVYELAPPANGEEYAWLVARRVSRVVADFAPSNGASLTMTVDPSHWLDGVDFASLPVASDGTRTFAGSVAQSQLRSGLGQVEGFEFELAAPP